MDDQEDTDTLLALLCSLLPDNIAPSQHSLLDALLQAEGDAEKAAEIILKQRTNGKRKRNVSLDSWLTRPAGTSKDANDQPLSSPDSSTLHSQLGSESPHKHKKPRSVSDTSTTKSNLLPLSKPVKPVKNLLDVLRQPPSLAASLPRLPLLMLSNPSLVAQHTPCTLHLGILPPELACHLFYTMLHEARDWPRNKWWLVDRLVESPHRSSLYTRHPVEGDNEAAWQGITRAWWGTKTPLFLLYSYASLGIMADRAKSPKNFPHSWRRLVRLLRRPSMPRCASANGFLWSGVEIPGILMARVWSGEPTLPRQIVMRVPRKLLDSIRIA